MDQFFDGIHVRLRSRVRGTYLSADEDGVGVSVSRRRASLNAAWQVHLVQRGDMHFVLLRSAAYGRYLADSPEMAPSGHRGRRAVQRDFDEPELDAVMWRPIAVITVDDVDDDDEAEEAQADADVVLRHGNNRYLRANGRHRRWHNGVTVDDNDGVRTTMMLWTVEEIPPRFTTPALPPPTMNLGGSGFMSLFRRAEPRTEPLRTIRYVRANNQGNFNQLGWATLQFYGTSVYLLMLRLVYHLDIRNEGNALGIVLCVRAGNYARLTPLVTDLPRCEEPMDIVILATGSYAAAQLRHPNVDEP
ncbi:uncharacterized protein LOC8070867 [Sorghum bicolor]|uniref:uncharacterized protein LOC8070867 n=1 Tax=Sorghum bicolor TaxID=4558 RepID=UPI0007F1CECA|nr:uncharacterized protein LOC8070867 [Sorghum bicolor]|eukprot:XP_021304981.1 uncharacterized protein LOC8070867 [Sorghum bicolor]